jgi:hypothetical protein
MTLKLADLFPFQGKSSRYELCWLGFNPKVSLFSHQRGIYEDHLILNLSMSRNMLAYPKPQKKGSMFYSRHAIWREYFLSLSVKCNFTPLTRNLLRFGRKVWKPETLIYILNAIFSPLWAQRHSSRDSSRVWVN